ncbi:hypothetical protein QJQ45_008408 [Haematococcus lacustris]|nr:hypothetical protein QJQ45_008408 [Haematococcus lacustris]
MVRETAVQLQRAPEALTKQYAELIPSLSDLARNLVRDLDPQNDLEFLRIRSFKHEIMVAARDEFVLIVIQDPTAAMTQACHIGNGDLLRVYWQAAAVALASEAMPAQAIADTPQLLTTDSSSVASRKPPQAPRSSQEATHTAASEPGPSTPPPAKRTKAEQAAEPTQPTKGEGKAQGKADQAKPAPQPGRWLDRDCNAALNMQRIGESRWRPLELCYWPDQGALPAKCKEYPGLGYKRLRDKPPKAQQQQQQPAVAQ